MDAAPGKAFDCNDQDRSRIEEKNNLDIYENVLRNMKYIQQNVWGIMITLAEGVEYPSPSMFV